MKPSNKKAEDQNEEKLPNSVDTILKKKKIIKKKVDVTETSSPAGQDFGSKKKVKKSSNLNHVSRQQLLEEVGEQNSKNVKKTQNVEKTAEVEVPVAKTATENQNVSSRLQDVGEQNSKNVKKTQNVEKTAEVEVPVAKTATENQKVSSPLQGAKVTKPSNAHVDVGGSGTTEPNFSKGKENVPPMTSTARGGGGGSSSAGGERSSQGCDDEDVISVRCDKCRKWRHLIGLTAADFGKSWTCDSPQFDGNCKVPEVDIKELGRIYIPNSKKKIPAISPGSRKSARRPCPVALHTFQAHHVVRPSRRVKINAKKPSVPSAKKPGVPSTITPSVVKSLLCKIDSVEVQVENGYKEVKGLLSAIRREVVSHLPGNVHR